MWLGIKHVIRANHMISLITSSKTDPSILRRLISLSWYNILELKFYIRIALIKVWDSRAWRSLLTTLLPLWCLQTFLPYKVKNTYTIRQNSVWTMHGRVNRPAHTWPWKFPLQTNIVRQTLFNSDDLFY